MIRQNVLVREAGLTVGYQIDILLAINWMAAVLLRLRCRCCEALEEVSGKAQRTLSLPSGLIRRQMHRSAQNAISLRVMSGQAAKWFELFGRERVGKSRCRIA